MPGPAKAPAKKPAATKAPAKAPAAKTAPAKGSPTLSAKARKLAKMPKPLRRIASHPSTAKLLAKIKAKAKAKKVDPATLLVRKGKTVVKKIGGENNGGTRKVLVGKRKKTWYPTEDAPKKRTGRHTYSKHKRTVKPGIEPGRVVIVLSGRHRGKRVVVLKVLQSGLLLVTGPYVINKCPVRRLHQMYTIVTSTKFDLSGVKVPDNINDKYFKKPKQEKKKKSDGDIFESKPESYKPSADRKKDQKVVDKQVLQAIAKNPEKRLLLKYLSSYFKISKGVYPHKLKF